MIFRITLGFEIFILTFQELYQHKILSLNVAPVYNQRISFLSVIHGFLFSQTSSIYEKLYIISVAFLFPVISLGFETHMELKMFLVLTVAYLMVCILIDGIMDLFYF